MVDVAVSRKEHNTECKIPKLKVIYKRRNRSFASTVLLALLLLVALARINKRMFSIFAKRCDRPFLKIGFQEYKKFYSC
jgi:hypothetical protein